ncbi:MAG: hypothetical protein CVU56_26405 [Deltaproteobacteria bacterium HGW-Deltaproteobacteria-14]|nr:MAG: hypothetical protein CVU56_26405 [Deltaproteobacteria bacterium HGW-Deltaproteobacteria-14]
MDGPDALVAGDGEVDAELAVGADAAAGAEADPVDWAADGSFIEVSISEELAAAPPAASGLFMLGEHTAQHLVNIALG